MFSSQIGISNVGCKVLGLGGYSARLRIRGKATSS